MTTAAMPRTITAVTRIAGHIGTNSLNTSTTAQARAMKMAPKMYFSTGAPLASQLVDAIRELVGARIERHLQSHEHGDGDGEDAKRHPQEWIAAPALHERLVGRLACLGELFR